MWIPDLALAETKFEAIVRAIARDLQSGALRPGDRLPPQRRLAKRLGLAVGTVSRAYARAEERGLVAGEVGRGTFVRRPDAVDRWGEESGRLDDGVDLSLNLPVRLPGGEEASLLSDTLRLIADGDTDALLRYRPDTGLPFHRAAGAEWIGRTGVEIDPNHIVITAGAQHGLSVILSTIMQAGEILLTAELTYPAIKVLAHSFGLRIRAVEMDEEGIVPEALDHACQIEPRPRALYLVPTLQNPLAGTLSPSRRDGVAEIAERHDLIVVEDDIHAYLPNEPALPVAARVPERTLYLQGLSKVLNVGLRIGFLAAPARLLQQMRAGVRSTLWIPAPLMAEIVSRWIRDGTADRIIRKKRALLASRQQRARDLLRDLDILGQRSASHLWLRLPEGWRSGELVRRAAERRVLITGAEAFAVTGNVQAGVRLALGMPETEEEMAHGLEVIRETLAEGPMNTTTVI